MKGNKESERGFGWHIARMHYLVKRTNRELIKMKFRTLGSAALIIIGVWFYVGLAGMVPNTEEALENKVDDLRLNDYLVHVNSANETDLQRLESLEGVDTVESRLQLSTRISYRDGSGETEAAASFYGIDPDTPPTVNIPELHGSQSRYFTPGTVNEVLVERNFARNAGIEIGDIITVTTNKGERNLTVTGLVMSPEFMALPVNPNSIMPYPGKMAVVYVPIEWIWNEFLIPEGTVNEFCFIFHPTVDEDEIQRTINNKLKDNVILFAVEREDVYGYHLIREDIRSGKEFAEFFALIILVVAFFIVYVSFTRIVHEQRKEIGILRALGYSRREVFLSYLYMALLIGTLGSIAGLLGGIPTAYFLGRWYAEVMIGTSLSGFTIGYTSAVIGLLFGPVTACLASGIAVRSTVNMEPQDAIRGTPKTDLKLKNLRNRMEHGHPFLRKLREQKFNLLTREPKTSGRPVQGRYIHHYTFRTMSRNRTRTLFTAVAVAFSIVIGSLPILMWSSFENSLNESIEEYEHWDIVVEYSRPLNETEAGEISSESITEQTYISRIEGNWIKKDVERLSLIVGLDWGQELHEFNILEGKRATASDEIMVNEIFASDNSIDLGDILVFDTLDGKMEFVTTALVNDYIGEFFMDIEMINEFVGEPLYSGMYALVESGKENEVRDEFRSSILVSDAQTKDGTLSGLLDYMGDFVAMIYLFSLLGVIIAGATLANTVFIGVLERLPEFGQLRAIGYSRKEIAQGLYFEISSIILTGSILGAPLAYLFLLGYEQTFKEFFPTYSTTLLPLDWLGYLFVVTLTFVLAYVTARPSLRFINKMDIAKTVSGARFG